MLKFYNKVFFFFMDKMPSGKLPCFYGQDAVRQAALYTDRSCSLDCTSDNLQVRLIFFSPYINCA